MPCESIDRQVADYLDDQLSDEQRDELRQHLSCCDACRARAVDFDPTLAFSLLKPVQPSEFEIERNVMAVRTLVRQDQMRQELKPSRSSRPVWLAAAAAFAIMISAGLWLRDLGQPSPNEIAEQATAPMAAAVAVEATQPHEAPRVEVAMDSAVRVYQMTANANEAFVVILNPALEL